MKRKRNRRLDLRAHQDFRTDRCDIIITPAQAKHVKRDHKDAQEHAINGKSEKRNANVILMRCAPRGALGTIVGEIRLPTPLASKSKTTGLCEEPGRCELSRSAL